MFPQSLQFDTWLQPGAVSPGRAKLLSDFRRLTVKGIIRQARELLMLAVLVAVEGLFAGALMPRHAREVLARYERSVG